MFLLLADELNIETELNLATHSCLCIKDGFDLPARAAFPSSEAVAQSLFVWNRFSSSPSSGRTAAVTPGESNSLFVNQLPERDQLKRYLQVFILCSVCI